MSQYTIHLNAAAGQYEFTNGRIRATAPTPGHPAYWLAWRTAQKNPHLAAVAWRGAEVIARGRISISHNPAAATQATISTPTGAPYLVAHGTPGAPTTCTCEAYQRGLAAHNGHPYCKHIWANQAQRTLESLAQSLSTLLGAMRHPGAEAEPTHCRVCGREFVPGEPRDGDQCYDLAACSQRQRDQRNAHYTTRSRQWAAQGQRRYQQYCNSPLGAQAYVLKALANAAPTLPADKVKAAYSPR